RRVKHACGHDNQRGNQPHHHDGDGRADKNAKALVIQPLQKGTRVPRAQNRKDQDQRDVKQCPSPPCNSRIKSVSSTAFHQRMTHYNRYLPCASCFALLVNGDRLRTVGSEPDWNAFPPPLDVRTTPLS